MTTSIGPRSAARRSRHRAPRHPLAVATEIRLDGHNVLVRRECVAHVLEHLKEGDADVDRSTW
ncbi:MAG: hypothetical protein LC749_13800 [Actinobacteria bacterium]|nr:hypothetical protein [Actinomycetota bacterium]